jgi:hypothetical protein
MNRRQALQAWLLAAPLLLPACERFNGRAQWEEEVQLSDGRVVVVAVKVQYATISEVGGPSTRVRRQTTVRIKPGHGLPDTAWSEDLAAVLLDFDSQAQELVLVATIIVRDQCERWERPCPAYLEFRLRDDQWQRQLPLTDALFGRPANLLQTWAAQTRGDYVTLQQKRGLDSDMGMDPRFKCILKSYRSGC